MKKKFPDHFNRIKKTLKPKLEELDLKMLGKFNISYTKNSKDPFAYMVEDEWPYYEKVLGWYLENVPKYMSVKSNFQIIQLDSVKYEPRGSFLKKIITFVGNAIPKNFYQAFFVAAKKKLPN